MSAMLQKYLTDTVSNWEKLGHPALLERFVLRNGKSYAPTVRVAARGIPKECFRNATTIAMSGHFTYVEGFALHREDRLLPIHHAWLTLDDGSAHDVTLEHPENYDYFGVEFETKMLAKELMKNGVYGLLDPGMGLNANLMFAMDPDLQFICAKVGQQRHSPGFRRMRERLGPDAAEILRKDTLRQQEEAIAAVTKRKKEI